MKTVHETIQDLLKEPNQNKMIDVVEPSPYKHRRLLDDIGYKNYPEMYCLNDERQYMWADQQAEYGFDNRETWGLDNAFYCWLYERLKMYYDCANRVISLDFHKFEYEGETITQLDAIHRMIEGCEIYFRSNCCTSATDDELKKIDDVAKLWALVLPAMWWQIT